MRVPREQIGSRCVSKQRRVIVVEDPSQGARLDEIDRFLTVVQTTIDAPCDPVLDQGIVETRVRLDAYPSPAVFGLQQIGIAGANAIGGP